MSKKITLVVGTRPNFVKAAPLFHALKHSGKYEVRLVHTGQHYDKSMFSDFFVDLNIPEPSENLAIGSGTHATQIARIMLGLEKDFLSNPTEGVVIFGDVNSTLAAALVANKMGIMLFHVEAGLRSFDRTMPEEINRIATDALSDVLFTTDEYGDRNLMREGHPTGRIHRVGNIMIDSLVSHLPQAIERRISSIYQLPSKEYVLVTIHRPSNVDRPEVLRSIIEALNDLSTQIPVIFPVHPRTRSKIDPVLDTIGRSRIIYTEPMGYMNMLSLLWDAKGVITDSGGIQEEACFLRIPTLTIRPNTERPITIDSGTNTLVHYSGKAILDQATKQFGKRVIGEIPNLWDGNTSARIVERLNDHL